jgi:hypothetical protein
MLHHSQPVQYKCILHSKMHIAHVQYDMSSNVIGASHTVHELETYVAHATCGDQI